MIPPLQFRIRNNLIDACPLLQVRTIRWHAAKAKAQPRDGDGRRFAFPTTAADWAKGWPLQRAAMARTAVPFFIPCAAHYS